MYLQTESYITVERDQKMPKIAEKILSMPNPWLFYFCNYKDAMQSWFQGHNLQLFSYSEGNLRGVKNINETHNGKRFRHIRHKTLLYLSLYLSRYRRSYPLSLLLLSPSSLALWASCTYEDSKYLEVIDEMETFAREVKYNLFLSSFSDLFCFLKGFLSSFSDLFCFLKGFFFNLKFHKIYLG